MKKKMFVGLVLSVILVFTFSLGAFAATKFTLIVNGKVATADIKVIDGTTYVPLRAAGELLGADIGFDNTTKTVTVTSKGAESVKLVSSIGDLQQFGGLAITLNSVDYKTEDSISAADNDQYVIVDLTLQNTTDKAIHTSTLLQMKLQDSQGYKHSPTLFIDGEGSLDGEIAPGATTRGQVAFDVDKSEEYTFLFTGVLSGQASWTFKQ